MKYLDTKRGQSTANQIEFESREKISKLNE